MRALADSFATEDSLPFDSFEVTLSRPDDQHHPRTSPGTFMQTLQSSDDSHGISLDSALLPCGSMRSMIGIVLDFASSQIDSELSHTGADEVRLRQVSIPRELQQCGFSEL